MIGSDIQGVAIRMEITRKAIMSPVSKAEVSLSSQNDVRKSGYGMGDDEQARVEPR